MNPRPCPDGESDPSYRYWKAAISCLSTPEKRAVADEFLRSRLEGGSGADTLFALILLLEANGIFLQTLPEHFHEELIQPINQALQTLRGELASHGESQQQTRRAFDSASELTDLATKMIRQSNAEFESKVQTTIRSIDVKEMAARLHQELQSSTLNMMQATLRDLRERSEQIKGATAAAENSVAIWRRVHLSGLFWNMLLGALVISACASGWIVTRIQANHDRAFAAEVVHLQRNEDAFKQLAMLGISLRVEPRNDPNDASMRRYTVTVEQADDIAVQEVNGRKKGVLIVTATTPAKRLKILHQEIQRLDEALK
jgi:hypothetical protein